MSLVTALFSRGNRRQRRAISSIRLERLEVRRALAADDGSDPWDGYVPPEDDGVEVDTCVDPGDIITFNLPSDDAGDGAGDGLPQCWLPPVDDEGNPIPEPFWRSGPGDGGLDYGFLPPPDDALVTHVITPWVNAVTGEVFIANAGGWTAPSDDWAIDYSVFPVDGWSGDEAGSGDGGSGENESGDLPNCWIPAPVPVTTTFVPDDIVPELVAMRDGPGHAPTGVVATPSADGIVVTWNDASAAPGEGDIPFSNGYHVEMRRLRDATWSLAGTARDTTSLVVSGLDAGAHYVFRVSKTNIGLLQVLSSPSLPSRPVTTASAEGITVAITDAGGAMITWDATAASGERIVEYRRLASADWSIVGAFPGAMGVATIDGLPGGRHYTFRILSPTGVYTPRTRAVTTPDEVDYTLAAVAGTAGPVVQWFDPLAASRSETVVEYRRLKDVAWLDLGSVASTAGVTTIGGLLPNANYVFRLRQRDANGVVSRTVATRPVTFGQAISNESSVGGAGTGTVLVVNPAAGNAGGTEIAGAGSTGSATGSGAVLTGTLIATGHLGPVGGGPGALVLGSTGGAG